MLDTYLTSSPLAAVFWTVDPFSPEERLTGSATAWSTPTYYNPAFTQLYDLDHRPFDSILDPVTVASVTHLVLTQSRSVRGDSPANFTPTNSTKASENERVRLGFGRTHLINWTVNFIRQSATSYLFVLTAIPSDTSKSMYDTRFPHPEASAIEPAHPNLRMRMQDFEAVAAHLPLGIIYTDLDFNIIWCNAAWYKTCGLSPNENPNNWAAKIFPEDLPRAFKFRDERVNLLTPGELEFRWVTDDDVESWTQSNIQCIRDQLGQPIALVGSLQNTKRYKIVEKLALIKAQKLAEEGRLAALKEARLEQQLALITKRSLADAQLAAEEAEARRADAVEAKRQQELFLDVASHEMRNPISAIIQNAEFTKSSLEELRAEFIRLEAYDMLPECFSHTIEKIEEDIEAMESIEACGQAQARIANDILGLAQIQLSRYTIAPIEFDLLGSVRGILRMFKNDCRAKDISLDLVSGPSMNLLGENSLVLADPTRLAQILVNLCSNAIRFTSKSQIRKIAVSIECSLQPPNPQQGLVPPQLDSRTANNVIEKGTTIYLYFAVQDTGAGMTPDECEKLFGFFQQASPFTHSVHGGSGLGLWVARNLAELQNGQIEVKSKSGKGTVFRYYVQAQTTQSAANFNIEGGEQRAIVERITDVRKKRNCTSPRLNRVHKNAALPLLGLKILCCDDNQINRSILRKQLMKAGANVLLAADGQAGLDILEHELGENRVIHKIVMDIQMPVLDGLSTTKQIRATEKLLQRDKIRIVGLTGNARDAQVQMALDAGMDAVITKPYRAEDLVHKLISEESHSRASPCPEHWLRAEREPWQSPEISASRRPSLITRVTG